MDAVLTRATALADEVLFPNALATDAADIVPVERLDALAEGAAAHGSAGTQELGHRLLLRGGQARPGAHPPRRALMPSSHSKASDREPPSAADSA